jgi:hypothetical protein
MPKKGMETTDPYQTADLYYAAYLRCAGVPFMGVKKEGPKKVVFLFEDQGPVAMRSLRQGFFSDTAKVGPLAFAQAIRLMKGLIYADPLEGE